MRNKAMNSYVDVPGQDVSTESKILNLDVNAVGGNSAFCLSRNVS